MAGIMWPTWILVWKIMEMPLGNPAEPVHTGSLERLSLSEDGFYEIKSAEDFQNF